MFQPLAKQAVGLIQTFMMFELALRIRQGIILGKSPHSDTKATDKWISCGSISTVIVTSALFVGFSVFVVYITFKNDQKLLSFFDSYVGY